jgi:outer membrane receptor protein involved in Fe transport
MRFFRLVIAYVGLLALGSLAPAFAQSSATGSISGVVTSQGIPVASATVELRGVSTQRTTTDGQGRYGFTAVPSGEYQLIVTKGGFFQTIATVAVAAGAALTEDIALAPESFTSLRTIAHVSTGAPGRAQINQSTAAINTISSQEFEQQGQVQVSKMLNETPGIISWSASESNNGADQLSPQFVQIRGAQTYETESLIDGHPVSASLGGSFDPRLLNPGLLQSVEVVKGPGSMPTEINYAIGGTVNYITLQPTRAPQAYVNVGVDNWGGVTSVIRATGSVANNVLQYALGYATDGAPGPMQNYQLPGSGVFVIAGFPWFVNGQELLSSPLNALPASQASYNRYIGQIGELRYGLPTYVCCYPFNTAYDSKNELGKLRFNFSSNTSLTLSFLGAQAFGPTDNVGQAASYAPVGNLAGSSFVLFDPPAGYSGSVAPGTPIPFGVSSFLPSTEALQEELYQGEFRTTFGDWTLLARYFDGATHDYNALDASPSGLFAFGGKTWGGVLVCPKGTTFNGASCSGQAPVQEFFNGQQVQFSALNSNAQSFTNNYVHGESLQLDRPFGNGSDLTLSVDRSTLSGISFNNVETAPPPLYTFPPGASQGFLTESIRYGMFVIPSVYFRIADYDVQYSSHYTDNGGGLVPGTGPAIWKDATRSYNAPRIAFTWQPNDDISWRFAAGYSITPPFLSLLSSPGSIPEPFITGVPTAGYDENLNNGAVAPETALGYDIGVDKRFHQSMFISVDGYMENLRNMFLPSTFLINPDYFPAGCPSVGACPLFGTETENLGHARYEGVEVALGNAPLVGFGFRIQGDLMRAYAYDIPPGFYCTNVPASQCTPINYSTNLGIIPGMNFTSGGLGFNSVLGSGTVPYSMGYGELNYRTFAGAYYDVGATYFGNHNAYNWPAFVVVSGGIRLPVGSHFAIQLSGDNLTDQHGDLWTNQLGGIAAPLQPECVGKYGGPAYLAEGTICSALVKLGAVSRNDVMVIPQEGTENGMNYGPTSFRLQFIDQIGNP